MLRKVSVQNYKPFKDYTIEFSRFDVLAGKNNMGKSSLVDALRLISLEANYRLRRELTQLPDGIFREEVLGFQVEIDRIPFSVENVHHEYEERNTFIRAEFDSGVRISIVFPAASFDECFLVVEQDGFFLDDIRAIRSSLKGISMAVLPLVAPFEETEEILTSRYVFEWFATHRSPRHFRNIWYHDSSEFDDFRQLFCDSWPGADINLPEVDSTTGRLAMFFTEERITREIAWAGHGMQVWMQLLTYLAKMREFGTLILDEPEIFLHSDVQRKLVRILGNRAPQIIVTTHSVDIINEMPPEGVVVIDKGQRRARRLESMKQVQQVVTGLGSVQNVQLLGLLRSRFLLFVEGGDQRILRGLARVLGYHVVLDPDAVRIIELEGQPNWRRLRDWDWILRNTLGEPIRSFVVLDRDYRTDREVMELVGTLTQSGVGVHVWKKKEIENYLLSPEAVVSCLKEGARKRRRIPSLPTTSDVQKKILEFASRYRQKVYSQLLSNLLKERRSSGEDDSTIIADFEREFSSQWKSPQYRLSRVPGKEVLSDLSGWAQSTWSVSLSPGKIVRHLVPERVDEEVGTVMREIVTRAPANSRDGRKRKNAP